MKHSDSYLFGKYESNARSYCRSYPVIFDHASGSHLFDTNGKKYIDFLSGAGSLNYGHNEPSMKNAVMQYIDKNGVIMGLDTFTQAKKNFIESFQQNILEVRDIEYKMQFTSPTGTSVVESAVKLAKKLTGRRNIVSFTNAFHGMTGVSLSLTGNKFNRQNHCESYVSRLPFDKYFGDQMDTSLYFRKMLEDSSSGLDLPAAVIVELVQAEGGLNVASIAWLKALESICREFEILLIVDDIQAGCGRCGNFFSFDRAGIYPDMVCLSKSLSGIGLPMSLLLLKPSFDIWDAGEDNGTFRGNNLAFVSATTAIDKYWRSIAFVQDIQKKSQFIQSALDSLVATFPNLLKQRKGIGMIQGIEFFNSGLTNIVKKACFESGLIIEACGNKDQTLKLLPALNIDMQELKSALDIITDCLQSADIREDRFECMIGS